MKNPFQRRSGGSLAVSIAIHVAGIALLLQIVFRYPLGQLMGLSEPQPLERVQYVAIPPQPTENSGGDRTLASAKSSAPAALQAPRVTPSVIPIPAPKEPVATQAAGGTGLGFGVSGSGLATGVVPRQPDSRIALTPGPIARAPHTIAQDVDSIVSLAIGIVSDSIAIARGQRKAGDWTFKGKNGQTWGWDSTGIRLGKFSIPNALLALLPLNASGPTSPIEARRAAYIRRDVMENGQRSISEDEFRTAVKRIRERKEREKRQRQLASDTKEKPLTP